MTSIDDFFEIMSWLPAKPLHKFATIAKTCNDFLSETFFIEKQCRNSCTKPEESLIIQDNSCLRYRAKHINFSFLLEDGCCNDIPKKSHDFLKTEGRILSSSNGLILCCTVDPNVATILLVCNPVTRTWLPIELPMEILGEENHRGNMFFSLVCGNLYGNDENIKFPFDYTILGVVKHVELDWSNCGYDLYVLRQGEWLHIGENLPTGSNDLNFNEQVCCKDGVFFITQFGFSFRPWHPNYWPYVVHFNIENGSSKILPLPEEARVASNGNDPSFHVFGWDRKKGTTWFDSICLVKYADEVITIWTLEHKNMDKKSSTWIRILSLDIIKDLGLKDVDSWTDSFTILGKNMIFVDADGYIFCYCLNGRDFGKLEKICEQDERPGISGLRFNAYSTTLRPCLKDLVHLPKKIE